MLFRIALQGFSKIHFFGLIIVETENLGVQVSE